ncbi:cytochrome-c peroxidase [Phaeocystidibacter luteus]|uniref:Cytochrome-c peroxidase n=1 Tax=Phaeocystidibacter luteus TaxID=911197 RepID=A0A6N6RD74_9FLAO|nr:cytochrome-c peroxidase [Phaeocystidibacter luteus]
MVKKSVIIIGILGTGLWACQPDRFEEQPVGPDVTYITFPTPDNFPEPILPADNPLTEEGVKLGRHLFYEPRLSGDNSLACAGCHIQDQGFADFTPTSEGIDGISGTKNSMAIFNLAWQDNFFWDGRRQSLEAQAFDPVVDPIEMHSTWPEALDKLRGDSLYQKLFEEAFGANSITQDNATKAIAQFERTMISANSKFDQWQRGEYQFTPDEAEGYNIFNSEIGDCFHCHGDLNTGNQFGAFGALQFSNNGLDSVLEPGSGREAVTGDSLDRAKFKIPSLRNVEYTFPYMHDGRFQNLFEVIEFYNMGGHVTYTIDPNMKAAGEGQNWSQTQKDQLLAFLRTLSDPDFVTDTAFSDPF